VWFDETIKDLKDRYDELAKWEQTPERFRDPKLPAILAEDHAHPDVSRLRSLARRLWPNRKFDRETVQAVADEVRNLTGKNPHEVDALRLGEVIRILEPLKDERELQGGGASSHALSPPTSPGGAALSPPTSPGGAGGKAESLLDQPKAAEEPARSRKRIPRAEAEIRVRDWLAKNAKENPAGVTRDAVAKGTGVSTGQVSGTAAWQAFAERRKADTKLMPREIPLTETMEAVVKSDCPTPYEQAASREIADLKVIAALVVEQQKEEAEQDRRHKRRHKPS
jgi:hypothetical protein